MKKSNYRITLSIASILHILFVFVLPYGALHDLLNELGSLSSMAGYYYPKYITGYTAIRYAAANEPDYMAPVAIIFAIPVVLSIFMLLMMLFGKKRLSYIGYVILSVLLLFGYVLVMVFCSVFIDMGYTPVWLAYVLVVGIVIAQFVVGIVGCVKDGGSTAQAKTPKEKPKAEKKAEKSAPKVKVPPAENDIFASKQNEPLAKKEAVAPQKKAASVQNDVFASRTKPAVIEDDVFSSRNRELQKRKEGIMRCISGDHTGIVLQVPAGMAMMIGRDPAVCNVVLNGDYVSRRHCSVMYDPENNAYRITDFSTNGVFDGNGRRLPANQVVSLPAGSEINIENNIFRLG